ncbi:hypothetical protein EZE20_22165 [Arundinibacter roseus]|uniref:Uncharacterized protein n=1 Tax=Arundinibacter roseus TaxID=2070510 RepID=A0A4R4K0R7_9BACT|nr:hypothetical protein EZE20_22165 [Arundinibacter roseus]
MFCFLLIGCSISGTTAQTVNDVPISEINVEYIQIVGTSRLFSNKATIEIDFGQRNKALVLKDTQVRDSDNKLVEFNSMIDALNFMSTNGYEFVQAFAITVNNQNVYHYLMKKKKE